MGAALMYFLSYSSHDGGGFAERLVDALEGGSPPLRVWFDKRDSALGHDRDRELEAAIAGCWAVLFVVTRNSVSSSRQQEELMTALSYKKPVLPLRVQSDADPPMHLLRRQWIDFTSDFEAGLDALRDRLRWMSSPQGRVWQLEERLSLARRDLDHATPGDRLRIEHEIVELEQELAELRRIVEHPEEAKRQAAERIERGLASEKRAAAQRIAEPLRAGPGGTTPQMKVVNPLPSLSLFVNREKELDQLLSFLHDSSAILAVVGGPAGIGKTALMHRLLELVVSGKAGERGALDGVMYFDCLDQRPDPAVAILDDVRKLLPESVAEQLTGLVTDRRMKPGRRLETLLTAFSTGRYCLIIDGIERWLAQDGQPRSPFAGDVLRPLLLGPATHLKTIVTSRDLPEWPPSWLSGRELRLWLSGLKPTDVRALLESLDENGIVGLRSSPGELVERVSRATGGNPQAVETMFAALATDRHLSVHDLLDEREKVTEALNASALFTKAFNRLDDTAQRVLEAAAIFDRSVTPAAVDYLLQPYLPGISSEFVLDRMVETRFLVKEDDRYTVHPPQRAHALGQIPSGRRSDRYQTDPVPFTQVALLRRAAAYLRRADAPAEELLRLEDREAELTQSRLVAGFNPDTITGEDLLDIRDDVNAICSVLAARSVQPPVSVGLFGDWGSGKSFFMRQMRKRIRLLAERSSGRRTAYCSEIRQITFNAWHYADANLWASLMAHIFESLASDEPEEASKADALAREHVATKRSTLLAKATRARQERQLLFEASERLAVQEERFKKQRVRRVLRAVAGEATARLQEDLDWVERHAGQDDPDVEQLRALASAYQGTRNKAARIREEIADQKQTDKVVLVVVLGTVAIVGGLIWLLVSEPVPRAATLVSGAIVWAAGFFKFLRGPINVVNGIAERTTAILQRVRTAEDQDLNPLRDQMKKSEQQIQELDRDIEDLDQQVEQLGWGRQLFQYIEERSASSDYRKHLGIIATIRQDFEQLSALLRRAQEPDDPDLPSIERIILYIDDLDRCPTDRVVQVLEAVHLLLAIDLFIVVVGVDARWLLRSLEDHYSALLRPTENAGPDDPEVAEWASTPMNYLEKIFQIPYTLRPMEPSSYGRLMEHLMKGQTLTAPKQEVPGQDARDEQEERNGGAIERPAIASNAGGPRSESTSERPQGEVAEHAESRDEVDLAPAALNFSEQELEFMKRLAPVIGTPRAAKRLSNIYRLLRASMDPADLDRFIGSEDETGEYQIALLLLGVLIGYPGQAAVMFQRLQEAEGSTSWWKLVEDLRKQVTTDHPNGPRWERLLAWLDKLHQDEQLELPDRVDPYRTWALSVARFSFQTGHLVVSLMGSRVG